MSRCHTVPVAEYCLVQGDMTSTTPTGYSQVASPSFDVSIAEIFGTLACGADADAHARGLTDIGYLTALLRDRWAARKTNQDSLCLVVTAWFNRQTPKS